MSVPTERLRRECPRRHREPQVQTGETSFLPGTMSAWAGGRARLMTDWTRDMIEERVLEAAEVLKKLPGLRNPGYFSAWPDVLLSA